MSKESNLYYRRKGKGIIIEQKIDGKTKYIKTLPNPESLLELLSPEASYFNEENNHEKEENNEASKDNQGKQQ